MLKDFAGNKLFRKVEIRIVFPDEIFPPTTITERAGPGKGFGPSHIDEMLMSVADQLESLHPYWDFKSVELKPSGHVARFVFTFQGYKAGAPVVVPLLPNDSTHPRKQGES